MWYAPLKMVFRNQLAYKELTKLLSFQRHPSFHLPLFISLTLNETHIIGLGKRKGMFIANRTMYLDPEYLALS